MQGDIVTLAVAVVIGTAFAAVVKALVADILTPIIALIFGKPNFGALSFTINSSHFLYGDFINAADRVHCGRGGRVLLRRDTGRAVRARQRAGADPTVKECPECTSEIPFGGPALPPVHRRAGRNPVVIG